MRHSLLITLFLLGMINIKAQTPKAPACALPLVPEYITGNQGLRDTITKYIKYPVKAKGKGISGDVKVCFMVLKSGRLSNIKVCEGIKGGYGFNTEALRLVKLLKPWTPGKFNGKVSNMEYNVVIHFEEKQ